ncbi:MAG: tetratricopeptide repeat protein, partial [Gammaproteobacteria bacterium]
LEPLEDSGDDLGGDLGLDFDPGADASEPADSTEKPLAVDAANDNTETLSLDGIEFDSDMAEVAATAEDEASTSEVATAEPEFEFEDDADSANTKLDLARAYIDMGDEDGARDILKEVMSEGNANQQQQAEKLLGSI